MIIRITEPTPNILGTKMYKPGREISVTDEEYGNKIIKEYNAKKLDGRFSFIKDVMKARGENKLEKNANNRSNKRDAV